jgi:pimeloyl-ACP methyl ester carboxylesterase
MENFRETIPRIIQYAYSRKAPPQLIEDGVTQMLKCRPEVLHGDFSACDKFDAMKEVEKIDLPALIVCGEDDALTPVLYSQFLHSRIKGSKLEVLPNAGHMVMMESAQAFNEKVRKFIEEIVKG